jgi:uncharacterized protein (TIGR03790 family)
VRYAAILALLFLLTSWSAIITPSPILDQSTDQKADLSRSGDGWNETPFRDIAVPAGFTFLSYIDYSDVGVLINNNSDASKTIGYAFVAARNISADRVFLFDDESTPTGETINPTQFDEYFADPLRQMISDRNLTFELNYLVTTKGIPLRVNGPGNGRAAFDQEIGLIDGAYNSTIHQNWWATHTYGPGANEEMEEFSRVNEGFYLVTRLTGYTVETALGLIDKANNSFGNRGQAVLDLATNRNSSGYKWWNDMLYATDSSLNGTMGIPVHFNQNSTFVTNMSNVMLYASWGSNDGAWNSNWLPNSGFDTADAGWSSGARYWDFQDPPLTADEDFVWARQTAVKRNGNGALEGVLTAAPCTVSEASATSGLLAEYFDNAGISYNSSLMPDLSGREPDYWRGEANIDYPDTQSAWAGLDSRFADYWSVRHSGAITIPTAGNWTFYLNSDDGTKLWLDEVEVVNNQAIHAMSEASGTTWLEAGDHALRTEFFEHGGSAGFILSWEGPAQTKQVVPASAFTRGVSAPAAQSDLIHHWTFDEGNGTTAADSASSADLTLFGGNGSWLGNGSGSGWLPCLFGNCYSFDGSDDYAKVDVTDWGGDFSVSLWVNTQNTSQDTFSSALAVNDVAGDSESFQIMASGGNDGDWVVYNNISYSFGAMEAGTWSHLVVTFQNATLSQYLNGELVLTTQVPNGTIDSIELYKMGVNRAGSTYFEGLIDEVQVWNRTLTDDDVASLSAKAAWTCPDYSAAGTGQTQVEQDYNFPDNLKGHAWILYGYAMKAGWVTGDYHLEIDSFAANGTLLSSNLSTTNTLSTSWNSRTVRFRPHADATSFEVRMVASLENVSRNGSVYFDTMSLRAIRPHFQWVDGSIAETAVSTGGRTFAWGAGYGQSLVADLLEDGVSGVKGYVYEPYLSAVGYPSVLLPYYAYGYNFAEVNYAANPMISWMGTVVGDPKMAPYADILHDIELEAVRTDGTLSIGVNGSIEVILSNLAPGAVNGSIEVRDRSGNAIIANVSLQMPGGDQVGSRAIVSVNLTPTRAGFNEYVVRYVASDWRNPERVVDNNLAILNLEVNQPPTAESLVCSTWTTHRGDTLGCTASVSDDFGVVRVRLGWRVNGSGDNWTFIEASSTDSLEWYSSLYIPITVLETSFDLISEVRDAQGLVDLLQLDDSLTILNAPHTWFGVHVEGVDEPTWNGVAPLPYLGPSAVVRANDIVLKACVIDADHDPEEEIPMIIASRGEVTGVVPTESQFPDVFCYLANWRMEWGDPAREVTVDLFDSAGNLFTTRSFTIEDGLFQLSMSLQNERGEVLQLAKGTHPLGKETLFLEVTDIDDPLESSYEFEWRVSWPGQVTESFVGTLEGENLPVSEWVLPPPSAGLEAGSLEIEVAITSDSGLLQVFNRSWVVHRQSPEFHEVGLCAEQGEDFQNVTRGREYIGYIALDPHREIESVVASLSQTGITSTVETFLTADQPLPDGCGPAAADWTDGSWYYGSSEERNAQFLRGFRFQVGNQFTAGEATLLYSASDIDGLRGVLEQDLTIRFGEPSVNSQSGEPMVGELREMSATVSDPDGHEGTSCTFIIVDSDGNTVMEAEGPLELDGTFSANWLAPASGSPFTSTIGCTDPQGHQTAHTREGIVPNQPTTIPGDGNDDAANESAEQKSNQVSTLVVAAFAAVLLLVIGVTAAIVTTRRREEAVFGEVTELEGEEQSEWSAPEDSRVEGEQSVAISEMAMQELAESGDLSEGEGTTKASDDGELNGELSEPDEAGEEVLNSGDDGAEQEVIEDWFEELTEAATDEVPKD